MKLRISSSILLCALTTSALAIQAHAASPNITPPGKLYAGIFGGWGSSNDFNSSQFGTAFYTEASGGPLAVNAFGHVGSESSAFYGAQIGYKAPDISISPSSQWTLGPAAELEAYSMNDTTFDGNLTNNTDRLPEHGFAVSYPMSRTIFLANAVLSFNKPCLLIQPYIGLGIGSAIVRISGADATQLSPPEAGINHYNSNASDTNSTFAGQIKLGLNYDLNKYVGLFAEYRWLYLASTQFLFGSTVYPIHVATSSWQVKMDAQRYNMGDIGIRFNL